MPHTRAGPEPADRARSAARSPAARSAATKIRSRSYMSTSWLTRRPSTTPSALAVATSAASSKGGTKGFFGGPRRAAPNSSPRRSADVSNVYTRMSEIRFGRSAHTTRVSGYRARAASRANAISTSSRSTASRPTVPRASASDWNAPSPRGACASAAKGSTSSRSSSSTSSCGRTLSRTSSTCRTEVGVPCTVPSSVYSTFLCSSLSARVNLARGCVAASAAAPANALRAAPLVVFASRMTATSDEQ
eukprot:Amastigsp_a344978_27.p3 type:complete len:247 gc:universal Amastigsp_a344978_27:322-1062(+)